MEIIASCGTRHLLGNATAKRGMLVDMASNSTRDVHLHSVLARGYWDAPTSDVGKRRQVLRLARKAALCFSQPKADAMRALAQALEGLKQQQLAWADEFGGYPVDRQGYLKRWQDNVWSPTKEAEEQFSQGDGGELRDGPNRRAKMRATHSSSALAWNFFGYFQRSGTEGLLSRLFSADDGRIVFEHKVPSVVGGRAHNLDLAVLPVSDSGQVLGVESKFGEPYSGTKTPLRDAYFPPRPLQGLWATHGLPGGAELADRLRAGCLHFTSLDAPQLLKHLLGLAAHYSSRRWQLVYLYFDAGADASEIHAAELARFEDLLGEPSRFIAMSYQSLYGGLPTSGPGDYQDWRTYIERRYRLSAAA